MRSFGTFISLSASVNGNHPRGLNVFLLSTFYFYDKGVICVTTGDRFPVGVICYLAVSFFCKTTLYNFALS